MKDAQRQDEYRTVREWLADSGLEGEQARTVRHLVILYPSTFPKHNQTMMNGKEWSELLRDNVFDFNEAKQILRRERAASKSADRITGTGKVINPLTSKSERNLPSPKVKAGKPDHPGGKDKPVPPVDPGPPDDPGKPDDTGNGSSDTSGDTSEDKTGKGKKP